MDTRRTLSSSEIRKAFLDFFRERQHAIVASAPIVSKDDPTLMFTNSGMAPFKDIFTGNKPAVHKRIADTQKCLRVSGKHNDLEEVGFDTYHHTMFEMLGNWSFGDYFKKDAIAWAWEFITGTLGMDKSRLYATYFEGSDSIPADEEARSEWAKVLPDDHILKGNRKDNFWEMGETGPCGPCTELHVDLRDAADIAKLPGRDLVNQSHPQVIEIWNLVFMQFERRADGTLIPLAMQSVDTGMGFERLCMAMQGKHSTYDTDVFLPLIQHLEKHHGVKYAGGPVLPGDTPNLTDVAIRVAIDHIRAIALAIGDGQLPAAGGAGYVIRRLIRRASRYGFQHLNIKQPFLHALVPVLADYYRGTFDELTAQQQFIQTVIEQEEKSFLNTLEKGLTRIEAFLKNGSAKVLEGQVAFELYDTYGFPLDLTQLIARENGLDVDVAGFDAAMAEQKARSKAAAKVQTGDWVELVQGHADTMFVGYDSLAIDAEIVKYRTVQTAKGPQYHVVLNRTPFYAESGGQIGDTGTLKQGTETLRVLDTVKENDLIVHIVHQLPEDATGTWQASVDASRRQAIAANHSATHLLHAALRSVLGTHVEQRGSRVADDLLRFDFSHFQGVTEEELARIETIVNERIAQGIALDEYRDKPIDEAKGMGAMALFGEKYGDRVRVIVFDPSYSVELCGGTHVRNTRDIRLFKLTSEGSVAAGIRRVEAVTAEGALSWYQQQAALVGRVKEALKNPRDLEKAVTDLSEQNRQLQQKLEKLRGAAIAQLARELAHKAEAHNGRNVLVQQVEVENADELKTLAFELAKAIPQAVIALGGVADGKPMLAIKIDEALVSAGLDAAKIVREAAKEVQGGGGGQPFFATAGGKNPDGVAAALGKARMALMA